MSKHGVLTLHLPFIYVSLVVRKKRKYTITEIGVRRAAVKRKGSLVHPRRKAMWTRRSPKSNENSMKPPAQPLGEATYAQVGIRAMDDVESIVRRFTAVADKLSAS